MKFTYLLFIILLTSCSHQNIENYRSLANAENINCHQAINSFREYKHYDVVGKNPFYRSYHDDLKYSLVSRRLEGAIRWWMRFGKRKYSQKRIQANYAYHNTKKILKLESSYSVAQGVKEFYIDTETAYFISKNAFDKKIYVQNFRDHINVTNIDELRAEFEEVARTHQFSILKADDFRTDNIEKLKKLIEKEIKEQESQIIKWGMDLTQSFEMYRVTRNSLEDVARDESNPNYEKVKKVLEYLSIKKLLGDCVVCGDIDQHSRPNIDTMVEYIQSLRVVKIKSLRRQLAFEIFMSFVALAPSKFISDFIDLFLKNLTAYVPGVKNVRRALKSLFNDSLDMIKFYPTIDGIIYSDSSSDVLAEAFMKEYSEKKDKKFLLTFERRIDSPDTRAKIYEYYKSNQENPHYQRMLTLMDEAREETKALDLLVDNYLPDFNMSLRVSTEAMFLLGMGYVGTQAYFELIGEVEDRTGIDILKDEQISKATEKAIIEAALKDKVVPKEKKEELKKELVLILKEEKTQLND